MVKSVGLTSLFNLELVSDPEFNLIENALKELHRLYTKKFWVYKWYGSSVWGFNLQV